MIMTDIEIAMVRFINEFHRKGIYSEDKYQMLHNIKYQRDLSEDHIEKIRNAYRTDSYEAAFELKTYYAENGILSNTIVLKMRPGSPEINEFTTIKVYSDTENKIKEYTHHAIEIFKEHGKYKVLDILHSDKTVWLKTYLDELCKVNNCDRSLLRYDLGFLAPCHAFAPNMRELSDLMRYLDKTYCIGKPRVTLLNLKVDTALNDCADSPEEMLLSDDMAMDFDSFRRDFGGSRDDEEIVYIYNRVYERLIQVRFSLLHLLCLGHIMQDPIIKTTIAESIFDDVKIIEMMGKTPQNFPHNLVQIK